MKILLINPEPENAFEAPYETQSIAYRLAKLSPRARETSLVGSKKHLYFPPLSVLSLLSYSPRDIHIDVIDERIQDIDYDNSYSLVGITVSTMAAEHSYKIATKFRQQQGAKVVMGGVHPSVLPKEAIAYADAVVIGEGELVWKSIIEDLKKGNLKKFYRAAELIDMKDYHFPRDEEWGKLDSSNYVTMNIVQTSRGCPHKCSFCINSTDPIHGRKYRHRSIDNVIEEISLQSGRELFFADDDIAGDLRYARDLFKELEPLKKSWAAFSSVNIALDDKLFESAARSGCRMLSFGFESLNPENLNYYNKSFNLRTDYKELISKTKSLGILAFGCFIVGFDFDHLSSFDDVLHFVDKTKLDGANLNVLQPYPATSIYHQLKLQDRLLGMDWGSYDSKSGKPCFRLKNMDNREFERTFLETAHSLYSYRRTLKRFFQSKAPLLETSLAAHYSLCKNRFYKEKKTHPIVDIIS